MKLNKMMCLALVLFMLLGLTACGSKQPTDATSATANEQTNNEEAKNKVGFGSKEYFDYLTAFAWNGLKIRVHSLIESYNQSKFLDHNVWAENTSTLKYAKQFDNVNLSDFTVYHYCYDDADKAKEALLADDIKGKEEYDRTVNSVLPRQGGDLFFFVNDKYHFIVSVYHDLIVDGLSIEAKQSNEGCLFLVNTEETISEKDGETIYRERQRIFTHYAIINWLEAWTDIAKGYQNRNNYEDAANASKSLVVWSGLWVTAPFAEESDTCEMYKWQKLPEESVKEIEAKMNSGALKMPSEEEISEFEKQLSEFMDQNYVRIEKDGKTEIFTKEEWKERTEKQKAEKDN